MVDEAEAKQALKEALKEWMDDKFASVGKWTLSSIAVASLGALVYLLLISNGWQHVTPK